MARVLVRNFELELRPWRGRRALLSNLRRGAQLKPDADRAEDGLSVTRRFVRRQMI